MYKYGAPHCTENGSWLTTFPGLTLVDILIEDIHDVRSVFVDMPGSYTLRSTHSPPSLLRNNVYSRGQGRMGFIIEACTEDRKQNCE